ncbi:MAG: 16S rRNA (uracil(1498)-N(3))-methyltransferase [Alphaproteobacteria bacterium]|nr:16S rRNA (uracil(1498)-N(3))-methyltransferase [Alphaproteobacteria bacterium]
MKNMPRIYINENLETGKEIPVSKDIAHYLQKVMRTDKCLVFNNGVEYNATIHESRFTIHGATAHTDPSNNITLAFAVIKQSRMEEMLNMAAQMGVARLIPVITDRVNEKFPKWERIKKIITEAAEQSGRNSIPILENPQKFGEFLGTRHQAPGTSDLFFADERTTNNTNAQCLMPSAHHNDKVILIGPEGGFSNTEFDALDNAGAIGISLGKTILRAETAAVVAIAKTINN